jgi:DNA mismatch repair protein MutS2
VPEKIIEKARGYLDDERSDIGRLINKLTAKQRELIRAEQDQQVREKELRELRRATDLRELRLRQQERELREAGIADLKSLLEESRTTLDGLIRSIRESGGAGLSRELTREAAEFVQQLRDRVGAEQRRVEAERELEREPEREPIAEGQEVVVLGSGKRGKVLRSERNDRWLVETDTLRVILRGDQLKPVTGAEAERPAKVEVVTSTEAPLAVFELDLRGQRHDEAIENLRRQLDGAVLRGMSEFGVIHGKGEGILQQAVRDFLKEQPQVAEFFYSKPEEGGFGKTIVRLKR